MDRKLIRIVSVIIQNSILFILSSWLNSINANISKFDILQFDSLIEIDFVIMGLAIALVTFVYSIIKNLKIQYNDEEITNQLIRLTKSINLNIKRMLLALFIIILIYFVKDIDISYLKCSMFINKIFFVNTMKIFIFFYISLSFVDVILCTLNLYEEDLNH